MQCNWCAKDEREEFTDATKLQEHKRVVHDADRRSEFQNNVRIDITDVQIVSLIKTGLSIRQSAERLQISHATVAYRLARIYVKQLRGSK